MIKKKKYYYSSKGILLIEFGIQVCIRCGIKDLPMLYYWILDDESTWQSDIVIHDIDPIRYHRNVIHPIEFRSERVIISMGLNPELLRSKKNKRWDYGSKYSRIYCYYTVRSSSYCLFAYNIRKNGQSKWLIWMKLDFWVLIDDLRKKIQISRFSLKWNERTRISSSLRDPIVW